MDFDDNYQTDDTMPMNNESVDNESIDIQGLDASDDDDEEKEISKFANILYIESCEEDDAQVFELRRGMADMSNYLKQFQSFDDILKSQLSGRVNAVVQGSLVVKLNVPMEICKIISVYSIGAVKLPNEALTKSIMKKILQYLSYHENNPPKEFEKPLKSANMREVVSEWDANFIEVDQEILFALISAAHFLDIPPLLDLTCAKVATMIKGQTPEEIRKAFNIPNDFSPEEEEAVRAENRWAEDS